MSNPARDFYEFGSFRLDPAERLLLRDGQPVALTPKAFETLLVLVRNSGHLVEKDELMNEVWPDAFVEEVGLARNISVLRRALGDDGHTYQYIETVLKRGYRFIAKVVKRRGEGATPQASDWEGLSRTIGMDGHDEAQNGGQERRDFDALLPTAVGTTNPVPATLPQTRQAGRLARPSVLLTTMLVFGVAIWLIALRPTSRSPESALRVTPVTSFTGFEFQPALSPDGNQVAFVWDQENGDRGDIYIKLIDAGTPLRLTGGPANDSNPAWSPNSRYIAFLRLASGDSASYSSPPAGGSGVYVVPALGGPEVKVTESYPKGDCRSLDWSPDGKLLAVTDKSSRQGPFTTSSPKDPFSIFLVSEETGEKRRLTSPPAGAIGDGGPAFSPDGRTVAFIRSVGVGIDDIYLAPVEGGELKRLTLDNRWIHGLAWIRDGSEIVFSSNRGRTFGLWSVPVSGGSPKPFVTVGQNVFHPSTSRERNHLVYVQEWFDSNIWRLEVQAASRRGNGPIKLIYSTQLEACPDYSPDGKRITFSSERSGSPEIWVCDSDGNHQIQLTDSGGPNTGTPHWSPDGSRIAFGSTASGHTDIYVISAEGGAPRRLTEELSEDVRPSWSRDGRWIYFGSNRSGEWQVWKIPAAGGKAVEVTRHGGREAIEAPDGSFVYYVKSDRGNWSLWRVPAEGGEETHILDQVQLGRTGPRDLFR